MTELDYAPAAGFFDELFEAPGVPRPSWVGAYPTNRKLTGETHVKIGHGRHYGDVPPIKGVYRGAAEAEHDVSVKMTRLDTDAASARAG